MNENVIMNENVLLRMAKIYLGKGEPTPSEITKAVHALSTMPGFEGKIDKERVTRIIQSHYTINIGDMEILEDTTDHEDWVNTTLRKPMDSKAPNWDIWHNYKIYLQEEKSWAPNIIESVDQLSTEVISRIENPAREGNWDRRGMVVGSVQSGKTANYMGLIAKAADAGYKLIVVIAGVHNSLRSQTQNRINEELIGRDLDNLEGQVSKKAVGVRTLTKEQGAILPHPNIMSLTTAADDGDFKKQISDRLGILPSIDSAPLVLVIKKHVSILKNVINWSQGFEETADVPMLLIDDECDYASVNTKKPPLDDEGRPFYDDKDLVGDTDPTATNRLIRTFLASFNKSAYIGYTATPFANIFIHNEENHPKYKEDLFPRSFIISLPEPTNYVGPDRVFGLGDNDHGLPLTRDVLDHDGAIPDKHKKELEISVLPESMEDALRSFILACTVRNLRGQENRHKSMLIHVTRYVMVQKRVYELVKGFVRTLYDRIIGGDTEEEGTLRKLWMDDFETTTLEMQKLGFGDAETHSWEEIYKELPAAVSKIEAIQVNGSSKDSLKYKNNEENGISVIAIGGDKLSRGLTLEGLSTSYYLRASKTYDTLMQMGRWFGYRDGYNDICRIYTTPQLCLMYRHVAQASLELKGEFTNMANIGENPETYGLKVKTSPGFMTITSYGKSRSGTDMNVSWGGRMYRSLVLTTNEKRNSASTKSVTSLLGNIGKNPDKSEGKTRIWNDIGSEHVKGFISGFYPHKDYDIQKGTVNQYIDKQNQVGGLDEWTICLFSRKEGRRIDLEKDDVVYAVQRTPETPIYNDRIVFKQIIDPKHEAYDLTEEERGRVRRTEKEVMKPASIRNIRPYTRGLLLIYPLHNTKGKQDRKYGKDGAPVFGVCISFPEAEIQTMASYKVNRVWKTKQSTLGDY